MQRGADKVTRRLAITKRQAQTLLQAAEAERAIVEVTIEGATFRLIPASLVPEQTKPVDDEPKGFL